MLGAGALGVLLTLSAVRSADHTQPVLEAAHDLAPGAVVTADDVRVARVHVDGAALRTLFSGTDVGEVRGEVVTNPMAGGELIARTNVRAAAAGAAARVMSFPLPRARAVDGKLQSGDHVDVVAVEHDAARAGYVIADAAVVAVDNGASGPLGANSDDVTVSLVVDADTATRLALALDAGTVTLVRATGAAPLTNPALFAPVGKATGS
jgi:Flp pilus assembly protein CpaB